MNDYLYYDPMCDVSEPAKHNESPIITANHLNLNTLDPYEIYYNYEF